MTTVSLLFSTFHSINTLILRPLLLPFNLFLSHNSFRLSSSTLDFPATSSPFKLQPGFYNGYKISDVEVSLLIMVVNVCSNIYNLRYPLPLLTLNTNKEHSLDLKPIPSPQYRLPPSPLRLPVFKLH